MYRNERLNTFLIAFCVVALVTIPFGSIVGGLVYQSYLLSKSSDPIALKCAFEGGPTALNGKVLACDVVKEREKNVSK